MFGEDSLLGGCSGGFAQGKQGWGGFVLEGWSGGFYLGEVCVRG